MQDLRTGIMKMYTSLHELAMALGLPLQQLDAHFESAGKKRYKVSAAVEVVKVPISPHSRN